jgi:[ribosomal protein S5]-alanine N-acetyltransferase
MMSEPLTHTVTMVPVIETSRLLLRPIVQQDIHQVFEGLSHPEVIRHYGVWFDTLESTQAQMDWYAQLVKEDSGRCWALTVKTNGSVLTGVIVLNNWNKYHRRADIGYWLMPAFMGQGIMTEALRPVLDYAFREMTIHRIEAEIEPANTASIAIALKLGFCYEGTKRQVEIKHGNFTDLSIYSLLSTDSSLI